jgi:hypothetical protein
LQFHLEGFFEVGEEVALGAQAGALAGGKDGFFAAEDVEGEGLEVVGRGFGGGMGVEDLGVGGLGGVEGLLRMI